MTTYTKSTDFAAKDALLTGNPAKVVKGVEINTEFDAIAAADATSLKSGGALGTPSSGIVTNLTGTAGININGTVGATTPAAGAFTTLSASGAVSGAGFTARLAAPGPIGDTTPSTGAFSTLTSGGTDVVAVAPGTNGNVLTSNGSAWTSATPAAATIPANVTFATASTITTLYGAI